MTDLEIASRISQLLWKHHRKVCTFSAAMAHWHIKTAEVEWTGDVEWNGEYRILSEKTVTETLSGEGWMIRFQTKTLLPVFFNVNNMVLLHLDNPDLMVQCLIVMELKYGEL
jgi:hypothetical protein